MGYGQGSSHTYQSLTPRPCFPFPSQLMTWQTPWERDQKNAFQVGGRVGDVGTTGGCAEWRACLTGGDGDHTAPAHI